MAQRADIAFSNLMLGSRKLTKKQRQIVRRNPYGDYDKDGIINIADCNPTSKYEDSIFSSIKSFGQKIGIIKTTPATNTIQYGTKVGPTIALTSTTPTSSVQTKSSSGVFVPTTYVAPTISHSHADQYRQEEQALYQQTGYTGGTSYTIPMGATTQQIQQAPATQIPTTQLARQSYIKTEQEKLNLGNIPSQSPVQKDQTFLQKMGGFAGTIFSPSIWFAEKVTGGISKEILKERADKQRRIEEEALRLRGGERTSSYAGRGTLTTQYIPYTNEELEIAIAGSSLAEEEAKKKLNLNLFGKNLEITSPEFYGAFGNREKVGSKEAALIELERRVSEKVGNQFIQEANAEVYFLQQNGNSKLNDALKNSQANVDNFYNELQVKVNSGSLTEKEANEKLNSFSKSENDKLAKITDNINSENKDALDKFAKNWSETTGKKLDATSKQYFEKLFVIKGKTQRLQNVAVGFGVGLATAGLGTIAMAGASRGVQTGVKIGGWVLGAGAVGVSGVSLYSSYSQGKLTINKVLDIVAPLVAASAGAYIGSSLASNYLEQNQMNKANKLSDAIKRSEIEQTTTKGIRTETQIKQLKVSEGIKAELTEDLRMGRSIRLVEAKVNPMNPLDKALIKSSIKSMEITGIQVQAQNGKWIDVGSILKVSVKPMPKAQFQESEQFFVSAGKGKVVGGKSVIKSAVLSFNEKGITAYPEYQFATSKGGKLISITDKSGNLRWIKNVSGKGNIFTGKETFYPTKEITAKNVADVFANTMSQPIYDTGVSRTFKTAGIHELTSVKINTKTELSLEQVFSLNEKGISSYRSLFGGKFTKKPITSYAKTFGGGVEEKPSSFVNMFKNIISGSGKTKTQTIKPAQISSLTSKNDLAFNYGNQIQNAFSVNMFKLNPIQTFSGLILPSLVSTRKVQQYKLQQIQMPKLSLGNKNQNILSTGTILLPEQKTTQEAIQSQYQIQDQEQIQDNIISPYTIGSYSFVAPKLPPYKLPKLFGFPIFPEKSGGYSEGKTYSYGKKKKRKTAYQSSVGAFALNIRMPKRKKYIMPKVFTGGELRPMINNNYTKQLNKMMTI